MSGIVLAMGVTAAPRITALVEMRVGKPTLFNRQEGWAISGPSLLRTVDGGSTWKPVKIIIGGRETSGEIRGTYFVSASTAWVTLAHHDGLRDRLGLSPEFVATHDGGATWRAESLPKASHGPDLHRQGRKRAWQRFPAREGRIVFAFGKQNEIENSGGAHQAELHAEKTLERGTEGQRDRRACCVARQCGTERRWGKPNGASRRLRGEPRSE